MTPPVDHTLRPDDGLPQDITQAAAVFARTAADLTDHLATWIIGHTPVVRQAVVTLLSGGHILVEGVPGLGKTRLALAVAHAAGLRFGRVQFTPDLMPADVTGTTVLSAMAFPDASQAPLGSGASRFEFVPGPVFCQLLLADEINRATPKTQSALLEAMAEAAVTVAGVTHALPHPFTVIATQNPLEMEGTYPLPEAQLDRFAVKLLMTDPQLSDLTAILTATTGPSWTPPPPVCSPQRLAALRTLVRQVPAGAEMIEYVARLVLATHPASRYAPASIKTHVRAGAGPRGAQTMLLAAKAAALCEGRLAVNATDVACQVLPALRHRLILGFSARAQNLSPDDLLNDVVGQVRP